MNDSPTPQTVKSQSIGEETRQPLPDLPATVRHVGFPDKQIYIVGTAHVSRRSVSDVRQTIEAVRPDTVCVELDEGRYRNLVDRDRWKKTNIAAVIRKGKAMLLLSSLIMTSFQRRIGQKLGVEPGAELLEATRVAEELGASLVLADRDIQITLKRTWGHLGLVNKLKMFFQLAAGIFVSEEVDEDTVEQLKDEENLADALQLLADEFPMVKGPLIDERDIYLAHHIRKAPGNRVVAVVGAGHVPGILNHLGDDHDLQPLERVPKPSLLGRTLKWLIPLTIVGLLVYGFLQGGVERSVESLWIWVLINGSLSALGAAVALGHPITIAAAFVAAPLTSLNPMLAAGWVSGLVQAFVKKPTVDDLESLPEDISTLRGFWVNPVSRILLVVALSNLGSVVGTFVAGSWIAARVVGS